jgi:hypothetical protein
MRFSASLGAACAAAIFLATAAPALADDPQARIERADFVVMEPNARVVFITTGGAELRADWTEAAKDNLRAGFHEQLEEIGQLVVDYQAPAEPNVDLEQLLLLYEVVSQSADIMMPHKGGTAGSNYDITLGGSASLLGNAYGADYAMFVDHYSQIESGGVFMAQVLIGAATGYTPPSQNVRATAGTIIDLETGNIVDRAGVFLGDPRDVEESANIVSRIMRNLEVE